ncbi:MAG: zf-HC2 domain-containing protein [Pseudomonadota bacterium]
MSCQDVQRAIVDLADGALPMAQTVALRAHIETCLSCANHWQAELRWRDALLHLPAPPMRPEFGVTALARARAAHTPIHTRHGFRTGFITAMAASIALWITAGLWFGPMQATHDQDPMLPVVRVALYQPSTLDLVFQAPEDFGVATIAMQLPANFEIAGRPGIHELTFESPLKQGNNRLVIPVVAIAPGAGEFSAKIHHLDKHKEFRIRLDTHEHPLKSQSSATRLTT